MKKAIFIVIIFLISLAILEGGCRLLEHFLKKNAVSDNITKGWQTHFFKSFLDWHEPDPDLLWRFKANIDNPLIKTNSAHLIGDEIPRHKDPDKYRILLLGDSSPVGIGLNSCEKTFGELLRKSLEINLTDYTSVELVNATVSGYTSEQIKHFMILHGWQYRPDLVILYCGNNDASLSGYFSDRELLEASRYRRLRRIMSHSSLYQTMRGLLSKFLKNDECLPEELNLRVSPLQFGENLKDITGQCQKHNCPLIIIKPPVPLLWPAGLQFKVFRHLCDKDDKIIMPDEMRDILGREIAYCLDKNLYKNADIFSTTVFASTFKQELTLDSATGYYKNQLQKDPSNPVLTNNLGVAYWEKGFHAEADRFLKKARRLFVNQNNMELPIISSASSPFLFNIGINLLPDGIDGLTTTCESYRYLDSALQADFLSLRIKKEYLEQIDHLKNEPDLFILDLTEPFAENGGERLFIDHCHPNVTGHEVIALELLKMISTEIVN